MSESVTRTRRKDRERVGLVKERKRKKGTINKERKKERERATDKEAGSTLIGLKKSTDD